MPSKQVTDRQKSAEQVLAATETHAQTIEQALQTLLQPYVHANESPPSVAPLVTLLGRMLSQRTQQMVQADEAHERELLDDQAPREERDEAAAKLGANLVELREIASGLFGARALPALGLSGVTPRDPVVLSRFASQVSSQLRDGKTLTPRIKGAQWDPSAVADHLDVLRANLDNHLASVTREAREAQLSLDAKTQAIAAHDAAFSTVASLLSELLSASGKHDLASSLRPSTRRPGKVASEESEDATPANPSPA